MLKARVYIVTGLIAYVLFMVALFPAGQLESRLKQLVGAKLDLLTLEGVIGDAHVEYRVKEFPESVSKGRAHWQWHGASFFRLQLGGRVEIQHPGASLKAIVSKGFGSVALRSVTGRVDARFINQFLQSNGVELSGALLFEDLFLAFGSDVKDMRDAEGAVLYQGGRARFPLGGQQRRVDVPELKGVLSVEEEKQAWVFDVSLKESGQKVGYARLDSEGWAEVTVLKRLLHLVGQAEDRGDGDRAFFNVKQKVI